jgi:hypothetical protein
MTLHNVAVPAKDGGGATITGGIRQHDVSGTGVGPNLPENVIVDSTGAEVLGTTADAAVVTDVPGSAIGFLRGLVKLIAAGINVVITNANANGRAVPGSSAPVVLNSMTGTFVAAGSTATQLGATGAAGDNLDGLLIIPATAAAGAVSVLWDGTNTRQVFAGGAVTALPTLAPFYVPLGFVSGSSGGFKITTGTNVSVIGVGNFT